MGRRDLVVHSKTFSLGQVEHKMENKIFIRNAFNLRHNWFSMVWKRFSVGSWVDVQVLLVVNYQEVTVVIWPSNTHHHCVWKSATNVLFYNIASEASYIYFKIFWIKNETILVVFKTLWHSLCSFCKKSYLWTKKAFASSSSWKFAYPWGVSQSEVERWFCVQVNGCDLNELEPFISWKTILHMMWRAEVKISRISIQKWALLLA